MRLRFSFSLQTFSTNAQHFTRICLFCKQRLDMTWCTASHETPVRLDYLLIASWTLNWDLISPRHRMAFAYGNKHKHCMFLFPQIVKKNWEQLRKVLATSDAEHCHLFQYPLTDH